MTPLIRPIAALCLVLLITSNSSRSQDKDRSRCPQLRQRLKVRLVSPQSSADATGNPGQPPANLVQRASTSVWMF
jgi:hypothetical protein